MSSLLRFGFDEVGKRKLEISFSFLPKHILTEAVHNPHTTTPYHQHAGFNQDMESILPLRRAVKSQNSPHHLLGALEHFHWPLAPKTCKYLFMFSVIPKHLHEFIVKNVFLR